MADKSDIEIASGTATFNGNISNPATEFNFKAEATFTGNGKVDLSIV